MRTIYRIFHITCLALLLIFVSSQFAYAFKIRFMSSESGFANRRGGFFPSLRLNFSNGGSAQTTLGQVADVTIDEQLNLVSQHESIQLTIETESGRRQAVLLSFDVAATLAAAGRGVNELTSASLVFWQGPFDQGEELEVRPTQLLAIAPPPAATWQGEPISWNQAAAMGLTPTGPLARPFDVTFELASGQIGRTARIFEGSAADILSNNLVRQIRFSDPRLGLHVAQQVAAGGRANFVLFGRDLPAGPGVDPGPWTNSALGDFTGAHLARSSPSAILSGKRTRELGNGDIQVSSEFRESRTGRVPKRPVAVVSSSNTLYIAGSITSDTDFGKAGIAGFTTSGAKVMSYDIGANCEVCQRFNAENRIDFLPLTMTVGRGETLYLHHFMRQRVDPNQEIITAVTRGGEKIWETVLPEDLFIHESNFMLKPDGTLFAVAGNSETLGFNLLEIDPLTGELRTISLPPSLDELELFCCPPPGFSSGGGEARIKARFAADGSMFLIAQKIEQVFPNLQSIIRVVAVNEAGVELGSTTFDAPERLFQAAVVPDGNVRLGGISTVRSPDGEVSSRIVVRTLSGPPSENVVVNSVEVPLQDSGRRSLGARLEIAISPNNQVLVGANLTEGEFFLDGNAVVAVNPEGNRVEWAVDSSRGKSFKIYTTQNGLFVQHEVPSSVSSDFVRLIDAKTGQVLTMVHNFPNFRGVIPSRRGAYVVDSFQLYHLSAGKYDFPASPQISVLPPCETDDEDTCPRTRVAGDCRLPRGLCGDDLGVSIVERGSIRDTNECRLLDLSPFNSDCSEAAKFVVSRPVNNSLLGSGLGAGGLATFATRAAFQSGRLLTQQPINVLVPTNAFNVTPLNANVRPGGSATFTATDAEGQVSWQIIAGNSLAAGIGPAAGSSTTVTAGRRSSLQPIIIRGTDASGGSSLVTLSIDPDPRLLPLDPDPNPKKNGQEVSEIENGGAVYRYFKMVLSKDEDEEPPPIPGIRARLKVKETGEEISAEGLSNVPSPFNGTLNIIPNVVGHFRSAGRHRHRRAARFRRPLRQHLPGSRSRAHQVHHHHQTAQVHQLRRHCQIGVGVGIHLRRLGRPRRYLLNRG